MNDKLTLDKFIEIGGYKNMSSHYLDVGISRIIWTDKNELYYDNNESYQWTYLFNINTVGDLATFLKFVEPNFEFVK